MTVRSLLAVAAAIFAQAAIAPTAAVFAAEPPLTVGSKAPALDIEHWIQTRGGRFKPVTEFAPGQIYVVEFWATWCGPCVASMPHLAATQDAYVDKGVTVVSVSDEDVATIEKFLDGKTDDEDTTYRDLTKAWCLTTDPDGSVGKAYMEASGESGIPTAFIVGKTGEIEWIGHPLHMDEPLEKMVAGTWDRAAFVAERTVQVAMQKKMDELSGLLEGDDPGKAVAFIDEMIAAAPDSEWKHLRGRIVVMARMKTVERAILVGGDAALPAFTRLVDSAGESARLLNEAAWMIIPPHELSIDGNLDDSTG